MFKIICFVCVSYLFIVTNVVRCKPDYVFNEDAGGWLKLHRIPATWQEAFLRCHYEGTVLASPIVKQLADALESLMTHAGVEGPIYLGTHDLYCKGHFLSIEGVPLSKMEVRWSSSDDGTGTGDCLTMSVNESSYCMAESSCTKRLPFICYKKLNFSETMNECGTFDDEYHFKRCTGSCYKVHQQTRTWSQAFGICASEGGHLVILNDHDEARTVKDLFPVRSEQGLWDRFHVGLGAWSDDRIWTSIHGDKFEDVFNVWAGFQPNNLEGKQNRVSFVRDGVLDDVDPDFKAMFVCEKSPLSIQFEQLNETTQYTVKQFEPEVL